MNEKLFKILDKMFPEEFYYVNSNICYDRSDYDKFLSINSLEDAFWLAEKVGLFDHYFIMKFDEEWQTRDALTMKDSWLGKTPQEAIVNAIIAIYGDKND